MFKPDGKSAMIGSRVYSDDSSIEVHENNGVFSVDLADIVASAYTSMALPGFIVDGSTVSCYFQIMAIPGQNSNMYQSYLSEASESIPYSRNTTLDRLETPTVVSFTEGYVATWKGVPNASRYFIHIMFKPDGKSAMIGSRVYSDDSSIEVHENNGVFSVDLADIVASAYTST